MMELVLNKFNEFNVKKLEFLIASIKSIGYIVLDYIIE